MICKPKSFDDEKNKVAIGYKNPLCLTRAKQVQPALYNGHVLVMSNHARPVVHDSKDTVTRKKQVTFNDKPGTSSSNTQKHEVHQKVQQTNVHVIHSTRVNTSTEASGSKPRSNTKKNRILPAKTKNKKNVKDHFRTNKSVWTKVVGNSLLRDDITELP
ncbi:hypothetical protein Tco_1454548 [Tanacetum coccineum]